MVVDVTVENSIKVVVNEDIIVNVELVGAYKVAVSLCVALEVENFEIVEVIVVVEKSVRVVVDETSWVNVAVEGVNAVSV